MMLEQRLEVELLKYNRPYNLPPNSKTILIMNLIATVRTFFLVTLFASAIALSNCYSVLADTVESNTADTLRQAAKEVVKDTGAKEQFGKSKNGNELLDKAQNKANQKLNKMAEAASNNDLTDDKKLFVDNMQSDQLIDIMTDVNGNSNAPKLAYWHVWTDDDGVSHQTQCELTNFAKESMSGDAAPQWNNRLMSARSKIVFAELPVNWVGEWHENPQPQWIIPLTGKWFVETMDGKRVEMGVGEVSFGGDQNTKADAMGLQGHLSGTVGREPCKMMIIQLEGDRWLGLKPGDLK